MWPLHGFANGGGIGGVVLAPFATQSIRRDELRRDQTHLVAHGQSLTRPMMGTRAGLHADQARRQVAERRKQLGAWHPRLHPNRFANLIDAMNGKPILGKIDPNAHNRHDRLRNE